LIRAPLSIGVSIGLAALGAACSSEPGLGASRDAIANGMEDTGDPAVVSVGACTGTLIAPKVVLTAAHCVPAPLTGNLEVFFGATIEGPGARVPVIDAQLHPTFDPISFDHDIALLLLAETSSVTPVPLRASPIDDSAVGLLTRVVGFGVSAPDAVESFGVKRQGTTTLVGYLATTWVDNAAPSSTCLGDSGGPAFLAFEGSEQLAGIASRGDASCSQFGVKTRVDAYVADFILPYIDATAEGAAAVGVACSYPEQCSSGRCATALDDPDLRYCTAACEGDGDCPGSMRCMKSLCRYSPPSPRAIGAPCDRRADCRSGQCVADRFGGARVCTVSCEPEATKPCREGFRCVADEASPKSHACLPIPRPPDPAPADGCCVEGGGAPPSLSAGVLGLLLLAGARRRKPRPRGLAPKCGLAALALAGCSDPGRPSSSDAEPCSALSVELGTGPEDGRGYLPLADGQRAPLVHGSQGGFHVWSNLRARDLCSTRLRIERLVTTAEGADDIITLRDNASLAPAVDAELASSGVRELSSSLPTFLCPNAPGVSIAGRPIRIELRADDSDGRTAADVRVVTPYCPEDDAFHANCIRLCGASL
jgi:hypothetical protein